MSLIKLTEGSSASTPSSGILVIYALTDGTLAYKNDAGAEVVLESGGGGSGLPQLMPENMSLDDTDTEVARGSAFSMIETIDYDSTSADGSAWITFHFPSSLDASADINLDLYYHLSGSDDSKVVVFKTSYWCKGIGEAPDSGTPTGSNTDNISTGTGEDGEIRKETLTAIPNASIAAGDTIILKLTREGSNGSDTYSGTFQLLYLFPYQS